MSPAERGGWSSQDLRDRDLKQNLIFNVPYNKIWFHSMFYKKLYEIAKIYINSKY